MNEPATHPSPGPGAALIAPGRLVLVVGPSGAGKDTLIALARARCADDPTVVFPRRIVTRAASAAEDHDTISQADFERAQAAGDFALWWRAHDLSYALPRTIDDDIGCGRTVICNVSRTMIAPARRRYATVVAVLITAPPDVLAARLAQRGRETAASMATRLRRDEAAGLNTDSTIDNAGTPGDAAARLVDIIRGTAPGGTSSQA